MSETDKERAIRYVLEWMEQVKKKIPADWVPPTHCLQCGAPLKKDQVSEHCPVCDALFAHLRGLSCLNESFDGPCDADGHHECCSKAVLKVMEEKILEGLPPSDEITGTRKLAPGRLPG